MCFVSILFNAFCSIPHIEFSMVHTDVYHVLHTVVLCKCVCVPVCKYCTVLKGTLYILQYSP